MKKIYSILTVAGLIALSACENAVEIDAPASDIRMSLRIEGAELVTKATEAGEDTFNENTIKTIHYYFFTETDSLWVYDGTQTINKTDGAEISLSGISTEDFNNKIFTGSRTKVLTLVVVNASTSAGTSTTKYSDILKETLTLTGFGKQDNLVMAGKGTLTKGSNVGTVLTAKTDDIELKRVASKITLHLIIPDNYIDGTPKEWIPQMNSVQIDFKNMGKNCLLNGKKAASPVVSNVTRKATNTDFTLENVTITTTPLVTGKKVSLKVPVYSYPRVWSNGDSDAPYIYVTIPWKVNGASGDPSETYYKILLPGTALEQNTWYDITAKLGGLGSLTKEGPVEITGLSINVSKTWKDAIGEGYNNTDADMAMPRVLAVEQNTYILYNENSIDIPFVSSHDCNISEYAPTTAEINSGKFPENHDSGAGTAKNISINNSSRVITFTHNLTNMPETGTKYDYKECVQTYKLVHKTDPSMYEYITIIQKPALCVSTEVFKTSSPDNAKNTIFVDGVSFASASNTYRVLATSKTEGTLTRVTASVLPEEGIISSYILGDVRSKTNCMGTAPFINGGNVKVRISADTETFRNTEANGHRLTYYYKAREDAGSMIAPEFIIASSLPGVSGRLMNHDQALLRCATFQEEGYPAGRWRLPTYAEMRFIFKLQLDGKIGTVFDVTTNVSSDNLTNGKSPYACADGNFYRANGSDIILATTRSGAGTLVTGSVRCVYDSWYWDNTTTPRMNKSQWTTFTWGDEEVEW